MWQLVDHHRNAGLSGKPDRNPLKATVWWFEREGKGRLASETRSSEAAPGTLFQ